MIQYRHATPEELGQVIDWAAKEGWNPGLDDAEAFYTADPKGFFVAVDGSNGPVAAISVVNHSDSFAFLGLYIVRPDCRGRGIGLELWNHALEHAGTRTVGLDGVEAQQENYVASGFAHAGGTTRFTGQVPGCDCPDTRVARAQDVSELIHKEAEASGTEKTNYLRAWFNNTDHRTTLILESSDQIAGFCTVRMCREGAKIGPLVADTSAIAERLIAHASHLTQGSVTLDVPEAAHVLRALCESRGLSAGFKTARMYRGPFSQPAHSLYAVTSLELG